MSDQTERLRIIIETLGAELNASELKQVADGLRDAGKEADKAGRGVRDAGREMAQTGQTAGKAGQQVRGLARELAQGDWRGAALEIARLGGSMGVVSGLSGAVALGVLGAAAAFYQGYMQSRQFNASLLATGNYAGLVSGQLDGMSRRMAVSTNSTVGNARETLQALVAGGRVTGAELGSVAQAAELLAAVTGRTRQDVVKEFEGMADGVAKFAAKANERYHYLNLDQYLYIKGLEDQGRASEAMIANADALSASLGGRLQPALGNLEQLLVSGKQLWSEYWDVAMGWGRQKTVEERMEQASDAVRKAAGEAAAAKFRGTGPEQRAAGFVLEGARDSQYATQEDARLAARAARRTSELAQEAQAQISAAQAMDTRRTALYKTLQLEKELDAYRRDAKTLEGTSKALSPAQQQADEAAIRAKYADRSLSLASKVDPEIEARRRLRSELSGYSADYEKQVYRLVYLRDQEGLSVERFNEEIQKLVMSQPGQVAAARERAELAKQEADHLRDLERTRAQNNQMAERALEAQEREMAAMVAGNAQLELQAQQVGLTTAELAKLTLARIDAAIAEEQLTLVAKQNDGNAVEIAMIERKIRLLERQRDLTKDLTDKQAADELKKKNEADSKKFSEDLRRDVTDSLQRAFESGKNPAEALASTLSSMIKTRLTRALAEAIANPILKPLERVLGGGSGGGDGDLFGGLLKLMRGTGGVQPGEFILPGDFVSMGLHSGGMVGAEATFMRSIGAPSFAHANRFHGGGLVGGEVPIIAKKGEGVFTEGQMKALAPVGAAAPQVTVNVHTLQGQTASVQQRQGRDGLNIDVIVQQIEDQLAGNIAAGSGAIGQAIEGRYNLRTAVV